MWIISLISLVFLGQASESQHGLKVGAMAPQIAINDIDDKPFNLHNKLSEKPVVLVFYRGGWCPYCNIQLRKMEKEVVAKLSGKARVVAISVDKPSEGLKTKANEKLSMTLLSDSKAKILSDYKLLYKVPEELVKKYKESYKIDLERSSGETHHTIAIPAVFVVDSKKKIRFAYVNPNYKERADNKEIVKAVLELM